MTIAPPPPSEQIDGLPNISGQEATVEQALQDRDGSPIYLPDSRVDFSAIQAACAIALHMHQPLIPAGGDNLTTADLISNLQYMMEHPEVGDNHNAAVFHWCYKRMGEFIPLLAREGKEPRVMLEYSGTLFHGLRRMGLDDVFDSLRPVTCDPEFAQCVEWLGMPWGHPVAPSTPVQDFRLHVKAWQQHFAGIFGVQALQRVRGFSPSEMALPNHPDIAYEFVRTLRECGYQWVLVQEHTVEQPEDGLHPVSPHLPHRLVCINSEGKQVEIIAIVKTQGSDTKLVAQMQPWYEAGSLDRAQLAGRSVPPLVTQIADGENGGVMMNEFPPKFMEVARAASGSKVPMMNVTEYLEMLFASGVGLADLPALQPLHQRRLWQHLEPGEGAQQLQHVITELQQQDSSFNMEGGSWTNNLSWVNGYDNVLGPMQEASAFFYQTFLERGISTSDAQYRRALFHLLTSQTSCYRYWGQGQWTEYGQEICRRAMEIMRNFREQIQ